MHNARLWFARIVALYAFLVFAMLAYLYMVEPLEHIADFGISANGGPDSISFLRVGPGALFAGMAFVAGYGLARPNSLRACLLVLVLFNAFVVGGRLSGIVIDGVTPVQLTELRDEGISWLLFFVALLMYPKAEAMRGVNSVQS